jgi:predicted CopG family antitoxin
LEGAPESVGGYFACSRNRITSLEGLPKYIGRSLELHDNPVSSPALQWIYVGMKTGYSFTEALVRRWKEIKKPEDLAILAPYNPTLSLEEVKGYEALGRFKKRIL